MKNGCCCGFVDEIWRVAVSSVRITLLCAPGVLRGGLVWNLGVNDATVLTDPPTLICMKTQQG